MKNCKLIVADLDHTLLRKDKSISEFTLATLNECRKRGILIGFATARPVRGVKEIRKIFEPDVLINHNGAVVEGYSGWEASLGIDGEVLRKMLDEICRNFPSVEIGVESNDVLYANYDVTKNWPDEPYMSVARDFSDFEFPYADKVLISLERVNIDVLKSFLPECCYLEVADGFMGMIMSKEATKFNAIATVCDALGIRPSEVVCFGDDDNDISMLVGCGIGVAMGNANDKVKELADAVCLANEEDGVARWVREVVLGEI